METAKTPIAEGQRIHYNFVKPHMALKEKHLLRKQEWMLSKGKISGWIC